MEKTMVMKILEQKKIPYQAYEYDTLSLDAVSVAKALNEDVKQVFKTLVATSNNSYYVFMIPSFAQLDLKTVAKVLKLKKLDMIPQKLLEPLTGYIHGGCSPLGMKKKFPTYIDTSATNFKTIIYSAGKIGYQVEVGVEDTIKLTNARVMNLTKKEQEND